MIARNFTSRLLAYLQAHHKVQNLTGDAAHPHEHSVLIVQTYQQAMTCNILQYNRKIDQAHNTTVSAPCMECHSDATWTKHAGLLNSTALLAVDCPLRQQALEHASHQSCRQVRGMLVWCIRCSFQGSSVNTPCELCCQLQVWSTSGTSDWRCQAVEGSRTAGTILGKLCTEA